MAKRRKFTPEFKAELVLEVLSGATSQAEVCRMTIKTSPRLENAWVILSHRCITKNAHIRR